MMQDRDISAVDVMKILDLKKTTFYKLINQYEEGKKSCLIFGLRITPNNIKKPSGLSSDGFLILVQDNILLCCMVFILVTGTSDIHVLSILSKYMLAVPALGYFKFSLV
jgi:hypothetical protein